MRQRRQRRRLAQKQIAEEKAAEAKAREERLNANPFTFDATPLKDDNGNPDNQGLMLDAVVHSLLLDPHRSLNPESYWKARKPGLTNRTGCTRPDEPDG
jgi:hypothetical protein